MRVAQLEPERNPVSDVQHEPAVSALVFFGACGAVSHGALDYAIESGARYVMGRTCCHDNIGGNVIVTARCNQVNRFFRFKNRIYSQMRKMRVFEGYYFSDRYTPQAHPRSAAGRDLSSPDEFMAVARDSVDSDICRAIVDLDRCLHLVEHGFRVEYQGELIVAERERPRAKTAERGGLGRTGPDPVAEGLRR
jgi:hypothetical protein